MFHCVYGDCEKRSFPHSHPGPAKSTIPPLTWESLSSSVVNITPAAAPMPEEAHMARGTLSSLTDARDEMQQKLSEVQDALSELQDVAEQLEENISSVESAIDVIENLDGLSIVANIEIDVDVSIYL